MIAVGERAPDFALRGTGGRTYTLHEHRGVPVVLAFYPADGSPVCSVQLPDYSLDLDAFRELGAVLLAVSPQDVSSHEDFAHRMGIRFPLLADTDRTVGREYGVVGPLGFYRRAVVVIDADGVVRHTHRTVGSVYPSTESVLRATRDALVPA